MAVNAAVHETDAATLGCVEPARRSVRVLLVAPFTPVGGGMGSMMAYLAEHGGRDGFSFDLVESRGAGPALASAWPALRAAWHILRVRQQGRAILHVNMAEGGSVLRKGILLLWAQQLGFATVLHLHAAEIMSFYDRLPRPAQAWVRFVFGRADVCLVLGQPWRVWLSERLGIQPARIEVLANGVPKPSVVPFRAVNASATLVFLGNLLPRKGLSTLLSALATDTLRQDPWQLVVAGGGDATPWRDYVQANGLDSRVHFVGWLNRPESVALLARASLLILPSYHEGLPLVLLEAASLGLPSITTEIGAIGEFFTHDETAIFVPPGDADALADAILRLLRDPALRARIGKNAGMLYDRALSIDLFEQRLLAIYRRHFPDLTMRGSH